MNKTVSKNPIRAILVGCGGMSSAWLTVAQNIPNLKIVGLVDLNLEQAENQRAKFSLEEARLGNDLAEALASLKPDVVFDCTIPAAHRQVTISALQAGCHVLGEKPMAENLEDARALVDAAERSGKIYAVIQNRRYSRAIRTVRKVITDGLIGFIHTLNADFCLGPHFGGFREEMDHVLLVDMAIHSVDQARFLAGADATSVYCHEYNPKSSWFRHGACAMGIFEMDNGSVFNYRGSWCAEGLPTSWQCEWRLIGEHGTLLWDGEDNIRIERVAESSAGFTRKVEPVEPPAVEWSERDDGHEGLIREFLDCIANGQQPMTRAADNILSLAMVIGAVESAETGQKINLQPNSTAN